MSVRTFRGSNVTTLMAQLKEELGDEVDILSTQYVGQHEVEVTVSIPAAQAQANGIALAAQTTQPTQPHVGAVLARNDVSERNELREALLRHGVHPQFVEQLVDRAKPSGDTVDRLAGATIEGRLTFDATLPGGRRVIALVGATGVGKTTTVAKLAANMRLAFNMRVGLVSADTFRVGASHHLSAYAELLGLPFAAVDETVPLAEGLYHAVRQLGKVELVFVDTSGFSPRDGERVRELGRQLGSLEWCEKMLVLPAPSNDIDLRAAARSFAPLGCSRVVISKTDETGFMGPVVNTVLSLNRPLAFLTTGQRVPEDIEPASAHRLGWMMTRTFH